MAETIRVVIVDDERLFAELLRVALRAAEGIEVLAVVHDVKSAIVERNEHERRGRVARHIDRDPASARAGGAAKARRPLSPRGGGGGRSPRAGDPRILDTRSHRSPARGIGSFPRTVMTPSIRVVGTL